MNQSRAPYNRANPYAFTQTMEVTESIADRLAGAVSGDIVRVMPGVYEISEALEVPEGVSLVGEDRRTCIIQAASGLTAQRLITPRTNASIRGLTLDLTTSATVLGAAIRNLVADGGARADDVQVSDCIIKSPNWAVHFQDVTGVEIVGNIMICPNPMDLGGDVIECRIEGNTCRCENADTLGACIALLDMEAYGTDTGGIAKRNRILENTFSSSVVVDGVGAYAVYGMRIRGYGNEVLNNQIEMTFRGTPGGGACLMVDGSAMTAGDDRRRNLVRGNGISLVNLAGDTAGATPSLVEYWGGVELVLDNNSFQWVGAERASFPVLAISDKNLVAGGLITVLRGGLRANPSDAGVSIGAYTTLRLETGKRSLVIHDSPSLAASASRGILGGGTASKGHQFGQYAEVHGLRVVGKGTASAGNLTLNQYLSNTEKTDLEPVAVDSGGAAVYENGRDTAPVDVQTCEADWTRVCGADDVTISTDTAESREAQSSQKFVCTATLGVEVIAYSATPATLNPSLGYGRLRLWVKSTVALDAGDLQLGLSEGATFASPEYVNIPAVAANVVTRLEIPLSSAQKALTAVVTVGVKQAVDKGVMTFWLDGIEAMRDPVVYQPTDSLSLVLSAGTGPDWSEISAVVDYRTLE